MKIAENTKWELIRKDDILLLTLTSVTRMNKLVMEAGRDRGRKRGIPK